MKLEGKYRVIEEDLEEPYQICEDGLEKEYIQD